MIKNGQDQDQALDIEMGNVSSSTTSDVGIQANLSRIGDAHHETIDFSIGSTIESLVPLFPGRQEELQHLLETVACASLNTVGQRNFPEHDVSEALLPLTVFQAATARVYINQVYNYFDFNRMQRDGAVGTRDYAESDYTKIVPEVIRDALTEGYRGAVNTEDVNTAPPLNPNPVNVQRQNPGVAALLGARFLPANMLGGRGFNASLTGIGAAAVNSGTLLMLGSVLSSSCGAKGKVVGDILMSIGYPLLAGGGGALVQGVQNKLSPDHPLGRKLVTAAEIMGFAALTSALNNHNSIMEGNVTPLLALAAGTAFVTSLVHGLENNAVVFNAVQEVRGWAVSIRAAQQRGGELAH